MCLVFVGQKNTFSVECLGTALAIAIAAIVFAMNKVRAKVHGCCLSNLLSDCYHCYH